MTLTIPAPVETPAVETKKTTREILREAAYIIEEHGWTQGNFASESGKFCMMGGMLRAAGMQFDNRGLAEVYVLNHNSQSFHDGVMLLNEQLGVWPSIWNDEPERTEAEVLLALRAAAELA